MTQDRAKEIFHYDAVTGDLFRKLKGGKNRKQECRDNKGYVVTYADGKGYKAHRIAWLIEKGSFPAGVIDHINGIKNDNRIENLREANFTQSCANRRVGKKSKLLPKGTRIRNRKTKYAAFIYVDGKEKYLGAFSTKEASAKAYNDAAIEFFGEFASLNELGIWGEDCE